MLIAGECLTSAAQNTFTRPIIMEDSTGIVAPNAVLKKISDRFAFTEGPARDKAGNVFFTDQPNNKIWKFDTAGKLSVFMDNAGRSNGMFFDEKGHLISCADEHNQLWQIDNQGKHSVLVADFNGKKLNGPNDVWVAPNGNMYFTDPYYQRDYWTRQGSELDGNKVFILKKGSAKPEVADDKLIKPNGIIGTPDGKTLYVADIEGNKTYRYTIAQNGELTNKTLFCEQGSDGMTMDEKGNVYLTGNGVTVYNSEGKKIAHIPVPEKWTANICFGGKNRDFLFITASVSVYTLKMNVEGI